MLWFAFGLGWLGGFVTCAMWVVWAVMDYGKTD